MRWTAACCRIAPAGPPHHHAQGAEAALLACHMVESRPLGLLRYGDRRSSARRTRRCLHAGPEYVSHDRDRPGDPERGPACRSMRRRRTRHQSAAPMVHPPGPTHPRQRWPCRPSPNWPRCRDGRARRLLDDPALWLAVRRGGSRSRSISSRRWRRDVRGWN